MRQERPLYSCMYLKCSCAMCKYHAKKEINNLILGTMRRGRLEEL